MSSARSEFWQGAKDIAPILPGIIPFGMITGVTAVAFGMSVFQAFSMSIIVVAGASQLVAFELLQDGTGLGIVLLTTGMINARYFMYSATLAPYFSRLSMGWKAFLSYLMVDQAFLLFSLRMDEREELKSEHWYYLGAAVTILTVWHSAALTGALVGTQIPPEWSLDFTIPLVFLAMIFPSVKDRPSVAAAVAGGLLAVVLRPLPYNLGFIIAALAGVLCGVLAEMALPKREAVEEPAKS